MKMHENTRSFFCISVVQQRCHQPYFRLSGYWFNNNNFRNGWKCRRHHHV